jgi:hypothetical protein
MMKRLCIGTGSGARALACLLTAVFILLGASPAHAGLKIRPVFTGGTPPPADKLVGGGNLEEIFKVAAEQWEAVFKGGSGNWDLTIRFGWADLSQFGVAIVDSYGGNNPVRITSGQALFSNTPSPGFFADPTPRDSTEYKQFSSYLHDDVPLNRGRVFSEATGDAAGRIDLFTLALHEIGHLLGFDSKYVGWKCQPIPDFVGCFLIVTEPRPFAGLAIPLHPQSDHLFDGAFPVGTQPLMVPDPQPGQRQLISGIDALAIAEFSSFDKPNLGLMFSSPW